MGDDAAVRFGATPGGLFLTADLCRQCRYNGVGVFIYALR